MQSGGMEIFMAVITITKDNFEVEVLHAAVPVVVDFWAAWCGPCRMMAPVLDELAEEAGADYKVGKINVDEQPELAAKFNIMSIPTLMVFKAGEVFKQTVGVKSKQAVLDMMEL